MADIKTLYAIAKKAADALNKRIFRGWCKCKANHLALKTNLFYAELSARPLMAYISSSSHSSNYHLGK